MTYTTNYNLKKPDTADLVKVGDLNDNADTIDTALAGKEDKIFEKVLELDHDYVDFSIMSQMLGDGVEFCLTGDQTGAGGLLHNARITGIECYETGKGWYNAFECYAFGTALIICEIPIIYVDGNDVFTIVSFTTDVTSAFDNTEKVRIHYIKINGIEPVTP